MGIPKRRSRVEQTDDIRKRLLAAARAVFIRDGYHNATLDAVVRLAGFTKGVVYSRYASKAELFLALLEDRVTERNAELPTDDDELGDNAADAMYRQWLARDDRAWTLLVLEFRIAAARDPELNKRYAAIHDRVVAAVSERVQRGAEANGRALLLPAEQVARLGLAYTYGISIERAVARARLPESAAIRGNAALFDALQSKKGRRR